MVHFLLLLLIILLVPVIFYVVIVKSPENQNVVWGDEYDHFTQCLGDLDKGYHGQFGFLPFMKYHLSMNYDLSILFECLQYGFILNVGYKQLKPVARVTNHASALRNPEAVDKYLSDEVSHNAMVCLLKSSTFENTHYSPLMTRDKADGGTRVIVDLSFQIISLTLLNYS